MFGAMMLATVSSFATEETPTEWPLERIVANLEARLALSPQDGDVHLTLGRARAFAFALERSTLWCVIWENGAWVNPIEEQERRDSAAQDKPEVIPLTPAQLLDHLTEGVLHLMRACELGAPYGPPELTTAWLLETGAHFAIRVDTRRLFGLDSIELSDQESESVGALLANVSLGNELAFPRELLRSPMLEKAAKYCVQRSISSHALEQPRLDAFLQRFWREQALSYYRRVVDKPNASLVAHREALGACRRLVEQRGFLDAAEETDLVSREECRGREDD